MFAGLPVVATRVGGIPSVVDERETGLLVERVGRPMEIADAILTLEGNPDLRRAMGHKGRAKALAEFGEDRYVRDVGGLYQNLVSQYLTV